MQIVIDIPEEVYKSIQDNDYCGISNSDMYNAVLKGTPLPKGHGRLIDADKLKSIYPQDVAFHKVLQHSKTVIKAESLED